MITLKEGIIIKSSIKDFMTDIISAVNPNSKKPLKLISLFLYKVYTFCLKFKTTFINSNF